MIAAMLWIIIVIAIAIAILIEISRHKSAVQPTTNLTISWSSDMEKYRASWNPSPSTFVEKHELRGSLNGGADAAIVTEIAASAFEATFDVAEGTECDVYLRTYGDNGTTADSAHVRFTAKNEQTVQAVEDFGVAWQSHIP